MNDPVLVVMAAGMGSRYGGLKQLDPIGPNNQMILDYSVFDANKAGFKTVIFVIKEEIDQLFRSTIGERISKKMNVHYVWQDRSDLPEGYSCPEGREKPWGTAQAVLAARKYVDGPFAVINADDYYGPEGFAKIYKYLKNNPDTDDVYEYAMVGYLLENTVTEHGHVSRGVCQEDENGFLTNVTERTRIEKGEKWPRFSEDGGSTWQDLPGDTVVSMNLWGFHKSYLNEAWAHFPAFLDKTLETNPMKGEYYLPSVVSMLLDEGKARVKVLQSADRWYGVTYKEDKPMVSAAIEKMTAEEKYPEDLWK